MSPLLRLLPGFALLLTAACTAKPPVGDPEALAEFRETNDPYEPTNRFFYRITDKLDTYLLRPVAVAYRDTVPEAVRRPIHNVLSNLSTPAAFADDVLQGKPRNAGDSMMRFVINSTAGVGGLFDVAAKAGYPNHDTDFGLTLALWGVGEGPYPVPAGAGAEQPARRNRVRRERHAGPADLGVVRRADGAWHFAGRGGPGGHPRAAAGPSGQHQARRPGPLCNVPQPVPAEPHR